MKSKPPDLSRLPHTNTPYWAPDDYTRWVGRQYIGAFLYKMHELGMHSHGFIEIVLIAKGHGWHYFGDNVLEVGAGDVFIIPIGMRHGYLSRKGLDTYQLLLHPKFLADYGGKLNSLKGYPSLFTSEPLPDAVNKPHHHMTITGSEFKTLLKTMKELVYESYLPTASSDIGVHGLALYVIQLLCRHYCLNYNILDRKGVVTRSSSLQAVFKFINQNYSKRIDLKILAQAGNCQHNYLCRLFKQYCGMSPLEYLMCFRLNQAERLILETDKRIKQIAQLTGFYDAAHLNKTFMRFRGYVPGLLRK